MPGEGMAQLAGGLASGSLLTIGAGPALAMDLTYVAMADSLSLAMGNAAAAQQRGQVVAEAALVQVLALIIAKGAQAT